MDGSGQEPRKDIQVEVELYPECFGLEFCEEIGCRMCQTGQWCKYAEQCCKDQNGSKELTFTLDVDYMVYADVRLVPKDQTWKEKLKRGENIP